jgi:hypothetical protein
MITINEELEFIDKENTDEEYYHIVASGEKVKELCTLPYNIKRFFSQSYSNNTVKCIMVKEKIVYMASFELNFGVAGTCGTPYTFVLDYAEGSEIAFGSGSITVVARFYDYSGKEIPLPSNVKWSWKDGGELGESENPSDNSIVLNSGNESFGYNVLQGTIEVNNLDLIAYLPIPTRGGEEYRYISGTTQIIYDSAGRISDTFRNPYVLYGVDG